MTLFWITIRQSNNDGLIIDSHLVFKHYDPRRINENKNVYKTIREYNQMVLILKTKMNVLEKYYSIYMTKSMTLSIYTHVLIMYSM